MLDLFDYPEMQPKRVREVLLSFGEPQGYDDCATLIQLLNEVGYTCEFGLDAELSNLRKIGSSSTLSYEDRAHLMWALSNQS